MEPARLKQSEMMQYCPRHAHGGVRIFSVEHVQINASRQGQHYDQHAEHVPIMGQIGLRNLKSATLFLLKCQHRTRWILSIPIAAYRQSMHMLCSAAPYYLIVEQKLRCAAQRTRPANDRLGYCVTSIAGPNGAA